MKLILISYTPIKTVCETIGTGSGPIFIFEFNEWEMKTGGRDD